MNRKSGVGLLSCLGVSVDGVAIGQDGQNVGQECKPVAIEAVKEAEQRLCDDDGHAEHIDILGIQNSSQDNGVQNGDPINDLQELNAVIAVVALDGALIEDDAQNDLDSNEDDLPHHGLLGLGQDQVTDDAQEIANSAGDSAKQEVTGTQETQLEALADDDLFLLLQEADGNHDDTGNRGTSVSKEQDIYNLPPNKEEEY